MELSEQLLKELQKLQELYKTGYDLVSQKVDNQATLLSDVTNRMEESLERLEGTLELLEEVISEKDVQIQRLLKSVAALTVVTDQLTERFSSTSGKDRKSTRLNSSHSQIS